MQQIVLDGEIWQNFEISNLVTQYHWPGQNVYFENDTFHLELLSTWQVLLGEGSKKSRQKLFPRDEKWSASSFAPLKYLLLTPSCSLTCVRNLIVIKNRYSEGHLVMPKMCMKIQQIKSWSSIANNYNNPFQN